MNDKNRFCCTRVFMKILPNDIGKKILATKTCPYVYVEFVNQRNS